MPFISPIRHQQTSQERYDAAKEMRRKMTAEEGLIWARLRANRLGGFHFRRQQVIEPYIVDFYCHSCSLVIEIDGGVHESQVVYDFQRNEYLRELGYQVMHFTNEQVNCDIESVITTILGYCQKETHL